VGPVVFGGARRNAEGLGGFFVGQADEVAKFDDLSFDRMFGSKSFQRFMDGQELVVIAGTGQFHSFERHAALPTAVAQSAFLASAIDQNVAHGLSGGREEMSAILEAIIAAGNEAQPDFMDEGGGLERVSRGFVGDAMGRELTQLFIDQRQ